MLASPELILESAQAPQLRELLIRSLAKVPLYRRAASSSAETNPVTRLEHLYRLPFLTKADIRRDFPRNFLGETLELEQSIESGAIELEYTSGTSEDRMPLLLPRGWWTEQEKAALRLNPVIAELLNSEPNTRRVTINSPSCNGEIRYTGVPSRIERTVGNALFLTLSRYPFLWGEAELSRMTSELLAWQPRFLDLDPVYGTVFGLYCERKSIRIPSLRFIVSSYEFLSVTHRRILERAFGVPVFDLYGSTETGHLLMEDDRRRMRPSLAAAVLEVIDVDASGVGELIVTSLSNELMPLIRYRIGDLVERIEEPYGTHYVLHGRVADAVCLRPGRRVTARHIDQCFAGIPGVTSYQLTQSPAGEWRMRFVPDGVGPGSEGIAILADGLTQLLELEHKLLIEQTDILMPESSGKFRLVCQTKRNLNTGPN